MREVITWAVIYMLTMFLGYALKRLGVFRPEDKAVLSNVIFYVTLPAMLISSFGGVSVDLWFLASLALGLLCNALMVAAASLYARRKPCEVQALYIVNCAGFNVGNLAMPFLRNFFPTGIPYLCMFDMGDSFFSLGTTYALACMRLGRKSGSKLKSILSSLFTSVPFIVYLLMTLLSFLKVTLPAPILQTADFMGRGNGFLAMLMVGISLDLKLDRKDIGEVLQMLFLRYACGIIFALAIFHLLPAPLVMRQVLSLAVFAAVPNAALIYTTRLNIPASAAYALHPLSTALMIPTLSAVMLLLR
ncbi:MAG: hypothetical protein HFF90_01500 [Oscillibacter sp.]|nr:hypothetical protein [Oscillibacter sp.]